MAIHFVHESPQGSIKLVNVYSSDVCILDTIVINTSFVYFFGGTQEILNHRATSKAVGKIRLFQNSPSRALVADFRLSGRQFVRILSEPTAPVDTAHGIDT